MESDLGKRIAVVGGGGKTTHSRALAQRFNLAFIELDAIHWKPGWVEREAAEFQALSGTALDRATCGWVTDGNYFTKLGDPVIRRADTVNWVNLPWRVMFWRIFW